VHNQEEALDLVQETMIRFYSGFHNLESNESALAWIYTTARNKCLDFLRREKFKKKLLNLLSLSNVFSYEADSLESLRMKEIMDAVQKLPEQARELILLSMDACLSQSDIAAILDIPAGTVKSRLFYARRRLKEILKENYGELS
jgi:RNA polymerase sigma-70 factor (ECF subfamily)